MLIAPNFKLSSGNIVDGMVYVKIDLSKMSDEASCLLFSWSEIWLKENCKNSWFIEAKEFERRREDSSKFQALTVLFQDPKEAVLFKLSPLCNTRQ
jgi:hypothetical protein